MKNQIFVSGATGFQGKAIAEVLIENGNKVVTISSTAKENCVLESGLNVISGSIEDRTAISKALKGVQKAVYTFPLIFDIEKAQSYTSNFIAAAEEAGISLVVFNAGFDLPKNDTGLLTMDLKRVIKNLFDSSNLHVITLVPDIYIDNLSAPWSVPVILNEGILPYPITSGEQFPWISHSDLARFTASAIDKPELAGKSFPIGGSLLTGEEIATAIAKKIKKEVNFLGLTPGQFEEQLIPAFGALPALEISNLYRYVADNKEQLISKDFKQSQKVFGVTPQSVGEWVNSIDWSV